MSEFQGRRGLDGDFESVLKKAGAQECRLPQEARGAVGLGLGLGTSSLPLDVVWGCAQEQVCGKQLDEG